MSIDINAPEVQDAIKEAVNDAVSGLKNKNAELLSELKKARKNSEIDPEDYSRIKDEKSDLEDKLAEAQKAMKASASEFDKMKKAYESETGFNQKLLIDNGLKDELLKIGVSDADYIDLLAAKFRGQTSVKTEGDNRIPVIGDKSISDFLKSWAETDSAKKFIAAPLNQGGGGSGGASQGGQVKTMTGADFRSKTPSEKMVISKEITAGKIQIVD